MNGDYSDMFNRLNIIDRAYCGWSTAELIDEFILVSDEADTGDDQALAIWMSMGAALILRGFSADEINSPWELSA